MAKQVLTDLDMGGAARVINLPAPVNPTDAVTKAYVDAAGGGGGGTIILDGNALGAVPPDFILDGNG
jgi:hypothetical protein